jgi:hypothetical protein
VSDLEVSLTDTFLSTDYLKANISAKPIYQTKSSFPVAAGVSDFEPARSANLTIAMAVLMLMDCGKFLSDPIETTPLSLLPRKFGHCHHHDDSSKWASCPESYYADSGMYFVTPLADNFADFPEATVSQIPKTKEYQVEYGDISDELSIRSNAPCKTYGGVLQLCLSTGPNGEVLFGLYISLTHFLSLLQDGIVN